MNDPSDGSAQTMRAEPIPLEAGGRVDKTSTPDVADREPRYRRVLIIADNDPSSKLLRDAFVANAYAALATSDIDDAVRLATTHDPSCILLMLSSLAATCDTARQLRQQTCTKIIAFSKVLVTEAERNVAVQSGCDDYRYAFLRRNERG